MFEKISHWLHNTFDNTDINKLLVVFATAFVFLWFFSREIAPFLGSILIAYLLDGLVQRLERRGLAHTLAVSLIVLVTVLLVCLCFYLLPIFLLQLRGAANDMPNAAIVLTELTETINSFLPRKGAISREKNHKKTKAVANTTSNLLMSVLSKVLCSQWLIFSNILAAL
jgi:putative permease